MTHPLWMYIVASISLIGILLMLAFAAMEWRENRKGRP
jgi:hypothetical protein